MTYRVPKTLTPNAITTTLTGLLTVIAISTSLLLVGCGGPTESPETVMPTSGMEDAVEGEESTDAASTDDQVSNGEPEVIRFVADQRLAVPGMMCPYSCWPKVKETLAQQPGVEAIQLAEQPEGTPEGEIKERIVELKLSDDFDPQAAIAALKAVSFDAEVMSN